MDLVKLDLKIFATDDSTIEPGELIPIFHRWIQTSALDELLIDVADYRHVHHGPAVLLLGHDGHYVWDLADGRPGLLYSRRRETTHLSRSGISTLEARLRSVLHDVLAAAAKLEVETRLRGRLRFRTDELVLTANDRLQAANAEATDALLRPALEEVLGQIFGERGRIAPSAADGRSRFALTASGLPQRRPTALLDRLVALSSSSDDERRRAVGGAGA